MLGLHEDRLANFLRKLEAGYLDNPYHSRVHAAGVLQTTHMLSQSLIEEGIYDPVLQLSAYLSALGHDFSHPGLTNDFLIRSRHELAIFYNVGVLTKLPQLLHHSCALYAGCRFFHHFCCPPVFLPFWPMGWM